MSQQSLYSASIRLRDDVTAYRRILDGVIDLQLHLAPDVVKRACDDIEFADPARQVGYRAFLLKSHHMATADRAYLIRRTVTGIEAYGGVTLNHAVGGLNPEAVEGAILLGAKQVWMPTFSAANHLKHFGSASLPGLERIKEVKKSARAQGGITLLDDVGQLKPEVTEVLAMIADADIILGTGHISLAEVQELVRVARRAGAKKILVTHPEFRATNWPAEEQARLADMGAYMEHCAVANYSAELIATNIKEVGAEKSILSSDAGQVGKGHPIDVMKQFILDLMKEGISEKEIWVMSRENPAKLLNLG